MNGAPNAALNADGVTLRPLTIEDSLALHAAHADPIVHQYWSSPAHETLAQTRDYVAATLAIPDAQVWAILDESEAVAGRIGLFKVREGVGELGIILRQDAAGKRLGARALARVVEHAFADGFHRLVADIDPDNAASLRLFERAGFEREGHLRQNWITHIGIRDTILLAKVRNAP